VMTTIPRVMPGHGPRGAGGQIWATMRAEAVMQWRRWGLWVAFGCTAGLVFLLTLQAAIFLRHLSPTSIYVVRNYTTTDLENLMASATTIYGAMFFGIVAALLVVDRLARDQRLGMAELQRATPLGSGRYVLGKFLGNYAAMLAPIFVTYLVCALTTVLLGWSPILIQKFLLAFLLVALPSALAAMGLALVLASFLPLRVVQVGFALLWFELNIGPGWHKLVYTIANPSGLYVSPVVFPTPPMQYTEPGFQTSPSLALLNIATLLLTALVALPLAYGSVALRRRRAERG
jgi:ABC-2 family transporter